MSEDKSKVDNFEMFGNDIHLEAVIGENNFQEPWFLELGFERSKAVCLIPGNGTGFLIGNSIMMTNWHVFRDKDWAEGVEVLFNYQNNSRGLIENEESYLLKPDVFFISTKELDYAAVWVDGEPGLKHGVVKMPNSMILRDKSRVNLIQHPEGGPKKVVTRDNQVVHIGDDVIQYVADTEHGSSGSPVFNDKWELVGLHYRWMEDKQSNGQILCYNEAHRIDVIMNHLKPNLP